MTAKMTFLYTQAFPPKVDTYTTWSLLIRNRFLWQGLMGDHEHFSMMAALSDRGITDRADCKKALYPGQ